MPSLKLDNLEAWKNFVKLSLGPRFKKGQVLQEVQHFGDSFSFKFSKTLRIVSFAEGCKMCVN